MPIIPELIARQLPNRHFGVAYDTAGAGAMYSTTVAGAAIIAGAGVTDTATGAGVIDTGAEKPRRPENMVGTKNPDDTQPRQLEHL